MERELILAAAAIENAIAKFYFISFTHTHFFRTLTLSLFLSQSNSQYETPTLPCFSFTSTSQLGYYWKLNLMAEFCEDEI